jgi:GH15 family glucan-1,4-alpha-glucosidase
VSPKIEDYALIGDLETAALVGRNGSIDWLCLPRFDAGACFAALLGNSDHGRWRISPLGKARVERRYRPGTLILETDFHTTDGDVTLIDCMPLRQDCPNLVRIVVGKRGVVPMSMDLVIRTDYGSLVPWVSRQGSDLVAVAGPDKIRLRTSVPLKGERFRTISRFDVTKGQRIPFVFTWFPSSVDAPHPIDVERTVEDTAAYWRGWSGRCEYRGQYADIVRRSFITLKAMTYLPTGGIVAAVTTSLPERIGGVRNWDYRLTWLRDAAFALDSLLNAGYREEASAWKDWLLRAAAGRPDQLQIMYGLSGERRLTEIELSWLPGYRDSRPARIGNAAYSQRQLDVFGEVMAMMHLCRHAGLAGQGHGWELQYALTEHLEKVWRKPDEGIWEVRGGARQFTHSKVMAWVALDRVVRDAEEFGLAGPVDRWRRLRDEIRDDVFRNGYCPSKNTFVQSYGSQELDASLLMMPFVGFISAADPRMQGTVAAIERELVRDGFVMRYSSEAGIDGLPPGEGAFLACTFWLADNLIVQGRRSEAIEVFERLLGLCNDVGLLSEQYDPVDHCMLGNFPQAFSHVALINTASRLSKTASRPLADDPSEPSMRSMGATIGRASKLVPFAERLGGPWPRGSARLRLPWWRSSSSTSGPTSSARGATSASGVSRARSPSSRIAPTPRSRGTHSSSTRPRLEYGTPASPTPSASRRSTGYR